MTLTLMQVALGGALGAMARYLAGMAALRALGPGFPWATLAVNVLGSFLMGILVVALAHFSANRLAPFLMTGLLGGFTTFSAFSLDALTLWERGATAQAAAYVAASVALSLAAIGAGLWAARGIFAMSGSAHADRLSRRCRPAAGPLAAPAVPACHPGPHREDVPQGRAARGWRAGQGRHKAGGRPAGAHPAAARAGRRGRPGRRETVSAQDAEMNPRRRDLARRPCHRAQQAAGPAPPRAAAGRPRHVDGMADALRFGLDEKPRLVHRLDKDTSGVLLLARSRAVAQALSTALRHRETHKIYWALVAGVPTPYLGGDPLRAGQGRWAWQRAARRRRCTSSIPTRSTARPGPSAPARFTPRSIGVGSRASWVALEPRHRPHPPAARAYGRHRASDRGRRQVWRLGAGKTRAMAGGRNWAASSRASCICTRARCGCCTRSRASRSRSPRRCRRTWRRAGETLRLDGRPGLRGSVSRALR